MAKQGILGGKAHAFKRAVQRHREAAKMMAKVAEVGRFNEDQSEAWHELKKCTERMENERQIIANLIESTLKGEVDKAELTAVETPNKERLYDKFEKRQYRRLCAEAARAERVFAELEPLFGGGKGGEQES